MAVGKFLATIVAVGLVVAACGSDQTTRDDAGVIIEGGDLGVFSANEGDCVNVPDGDQIAQFEGVACTEPHDAQIYAAFDLPGEVFPGLESIRADADEGCAERWEPFFEIAYAASEYFSTRVTPTEESWNKIDDREVLCLVTAGPSGEQLTEDLRGYGANIVLDEPDQAATGDPTTDGAADDPADGGTGSGDADATVEALDPAEGAGPLVVAGTLSPGGKDAYSVVLESGQSIGVTLSVTGGASSITDPVLLLLDATGGEVAANDDADGLNSGVIYTATANGTYTIVAGELLDRGGDYELAVEVVGAGAEPSIGQVTQSAPSDATGEQVAALTVGPSSTVSTSQTLETGTFDVISLTVDAPVTATITVTGGGELDTKVVVLSGGAIVGENDDAPFEAGLPGSLDSQVVLDLAAGEFEIQVRSFADLGEGDYNLEIVTG